MKYKVTVKETTREFSKWKDMKNYIDELVPQGLTWEATAEP